MGNLIWSLIGALAFGLLPALLMLCFRMKGEGRVDKVLHIIAMAALYALFISFQLWGWEECRRDDMGELVVIVVAPFVHIAWLLLASPWLIRLAMRPPGKG